MTVEIVYALVSGAALGLFTFAVVVAPLQVWSAPGRAKTALGTAGWTAGALVALGWIVRVLVRFDRDRRLGD